jgi:hypothetical protein
MKVVYALLAGFAFLMVTFSIFQFPIHTLLDCANPMLLLWATIGIAMLWLTAGQPASFSRSSGPLPPRVRITIRIVLGVAGAWIAFTAVLNLIALIMAVVAIFKGELPLPYVITTLAIIGVYGLAHCLTAFVLLRFAILGKPANETPKSTA